MPAPLHLKLLGPFYAERQGQPVTAFESEKARGLLAYLALTAAYPTPRESLVAMFWPDLAPRPGRHNLSQALSSLRRTLAEDAANPFFLADRQTIQFNEAAGVAVDVLAFEALLEACRQCAHARPALCPACADRRREAVALYRGDFLAGLGVEGAGDFDDWVALRRERLHRLALGALEWLADYHEARGELGEAEGYARRQVGLEPWREEAHRGLMRLLAHGGQRSAALAQYEACRQILAAELGVLPAVETTRLHERILAAEQDRVRRLPPQPTPFVGRRAELAAAAGLLAAGDCRLLTVVGPGGAGKSRLAIALAEQLDLRFLDGVCFVPLAGLAQADELAPAMAAALGLTFGQGEPTAVVRSFLRQKELLLILDNAEHLPEAADWLGHLLGEAPELKLLVTSRERLNLRWEQVFTLGGLACPSPDPSADEPFSEAETLFQSAARRSETGFQLDADGRRAVAALCRLVDGLPLALELAGALVRQRSPAEIAASVARSAGTLSAPWRDVPARHRSVWATLDYSVSLLEEPARDHLIALGVFRGSFSAAMAREIAGPDPARLDELADKSLLRREGRGRYGLHELVRQYAAEQLAARPERAALAARHSAAYAAQVKRLAPELRGAGIAAALDALERDHVDIQVAWERALVERDKALVDGLWAGQFYYHSLRGLLHRGREAFTAAREAFADPARRLRFTNYLGHFQRRLHEYDEAESTLRANAAAARRQGNAGMEAYALIELAHLHVARGAVDEGQSMAEEGLARLETAGDAGNDLLHTHALMALGNVAMHRGDFEAARARQAACLELARRRGFVLIQADALSNLGILEGMTGQFAGARDLLRQSLALREAVGDLRGQGISLANLGLCALSEGDLDGAAEAFGRSLRLCDQIGDRDGSAYAIDNFGEIALRQERLDEALRAFQRSLVLRRELGDRAGLAYSLSYLGLAKARLGQLQDARRDLREALALAEESGGLPLILMVAQHAAMTLASPSQSAAWLVRIRAHPALDQRFAPAIAERLEALEVELSPAAWRRASDDGEALDWETMVDELRVLLAG